MKRTEDRKGREKKKENGEGWRRGTMRGSPSIWLKAAACPEGREPESVHSGLNKGWS